MQKKVLIIVAIIVVLGIGVFVLKRCYSKTEEIKNNKISINEKAEGTNLAVTFTEFETPKDDLGKGSYKLGSSYEYTKEGYVYRLAHFNIENIGKETVKFINITAKLNYGDGYVFDSSKIWFHADDIYNTKGQKIEGGSWVNNSPEISPFDKPLECIIAFMLPKEVANGNEKMSMTFKFDNKDFTVDIK